MNKLCNKCNLELSIDNFSKNQLKCKLCAKKHYNDNKERIRIGRKLYREKNKEAIRLHKKLYREKNKEAIRLHKKKYGEDPLTKKKLNAYKLKWANKKYRPVKLLNSHKRRFKHVLKELLLRFTLKTCSQCKKKYDLRNYQHLKTNQEVKKCLFCRQVKNKYSIKEQSRNKNIYHTILKPFSDRVKKSGHCVDCKEKDWRVLEFDHVDPTIKKCLVLRCKTLLGMELEIAKCVLRCVFCHRLKTMATQRPGKYCGIKKTKKNWVTTYKLNQHHCFDCGREITNVTSSAFDFDHIDRTTKIDCIAAMIMNPKYTIEDIKKELTKTRLLCKNCHRKRTLVQLYDTPCA